MEILCPYCSKPWTRDMLDAYNGSYGCDTGCEYVSIEIVCTHCDRVVYIKGTFGYFMDDEEKKEYLDEATDQDIKEAVEGVKKYGDR